MIVFLRSPLDMLEVFECKKGCFVKTVQGLKIGGEMHSIENYLFSWSMIQIAK